MVAGPGDRRLLSDWFRRLRLEKRLEGSWRLETGASPGLFCPSTIEARDRCAGRRAHFQVINSLLSPTSPHYSETRYFVNKLLKKTMVLMVLKVWYIHLHVCMAFMYLHICTFSWNKGTKQEAKSHNSHSNENKSHWVTKTNLLPMRSNQLQRTLVMPIS